MKAAALYRVSTKRQVKDEDDSIPLQQHTIREFARQKGWELVAEYIEPGVSAYKLSSSERDILQDALKDAIDGKYRVLLIFKADRLSRNSFEYPMVLWQFRQAGVEVIAVADAPGGRVLNIDDQMEKLIRFIEGWQAETESRNTSIRVSQAMLNMAKQGKWTGGRIPYGYKLSGKRDGLPLEIDPAEAEVIREMVRMYLEEGKGSKKIAEELNRKGYRTKEGKLWQDTRVRDILQNPLIAGLPAYNRTEPGRAPGSRKRRRNWYDLDNPEIIIPRDEEGNPKPIPQYAIISLETWYKVVERMKELRANKGATTKTENSGALLTGFLKCGYCGRGFVTSKRNNAKTVKPNGKVYTYKTASYRCVTHRKIGKEYCSGQASYSQRKIDKIFLEELKTFFANLDVSGLDRYINTRKFTEAERLKNQIKHLQSEHEKACRRLESWRERLNQYFADPEKSLYSEEFMAEEIRRAEKDIKQVEKQIQDTQAALKALQENQKNIEKFVRTAPYWFDIFMDAPVPVKKKMLAQIIDKVVLYRDKIEIHYKIDIAELAKTTKIPGETETGTGGILAFKSVATI